MWDRGLRSAELRVIFLETQIQTMQGTGLVKASRKLSFLSHNSGVNNRKLKVYRLCPDKKPCSAEFLQIGLIWGELLSDAVYLLLFAEIHDFFTEKHHLWFRPTRLQVCDSTGASPSSQWRKFGLNWSEKIKARESEGRGYEGGPRRWSVKDK